jgi:predicted metal-dependent peptidase
MKVERKFKAIKIALMRSDQFGLLRGVAMHGQTFLTTDIPTAMTDGRDCWFNHDFLFKTIQNGDKGAAYVMVHEWLHKAGMHMVTYRTLRKRNPMLINMAADYWNNDRILLADPEHLLTEMPVTADGKPIGLHDLKYRDWTIKRIFDDLLENGGGEGGGGGGFDEHDWEGAEELSKEEAEKLKQDVTEAIRQGIHSSRKVGAGGLRDALGLEELITPKVDWPHELRIFMTATCRKKERSTWRRPNRRYLHQDIVMPTLEGNSAKEIAFCRDASGSMFFDNALTKVTSEMVGIAQMMDIEKIHLIDWDGSVEYRGVFSSDTFKSAPAVKNVVGGGGTDPRCVVEYLKDNNIKPDCVVMLTDGEVNEWGNWTVPVLWAIANRNKITAPVGKTINID